MLPFAVRFDGRLIGVQQIQADQFAVLRTVSTASWLARSVQGGGLGTEMRAAVLSFAFEGLGAEAAVSGAYDYNRGSVRVSEKLGYAPNGVRLDDARGKAAKALLFRLTREEWLEGGPLIARVRGLESCLDMFGAG